MSQEALKQKLHTLVADEARKIAESIVGIAACLVEQIEPQQEDGPFLTHTPDTARHGGHDRYDAADDVETRLSPDKRVDAVEPSPAYLAEPIPQDTLVAFPSGAEGTGAAFMLQPVTADATHQPTPHPTEPLTSWNEPQPDSEQITPPAAFQVWEHKRPASDVPAEIPTNTAGPATPPPHWLRHVAQQPPAHWVERVRHSAPDLLPYANSSDLPEAQHAETESAAPSSLMVCAPEDVDGRVASHAPEPRLDETAGLSPMSTASPAPWPEFLPEMPAHAPAGRETLWRAWEHEQKLRREQQGSRWNA